MENVIELDLSDILVDPEIQDRAEMSQEVIDDYAAKVDKLPPGVVYVDDSDTAWLAAGFHRLEARRKAGKTSMPVIVREGTRQDAVLHAVNSNAGHGLARTNKDKRRAVSNLLRFFPAWSDHKVADEAGVDSHLAADVRKEIFPPAQLGESPSCAGKREGKDGKLRPSSKDIFTTETVPWIKALVKKNPERSWQNIAEEVQCSPRSVDKIRKEMVAAGEVRDDEPAPKPQQSAAKKTTPPAESFAAPEPVAKNKSRRLDGVGVPLAPDLVESFETSAMMQEALSLYPKLAKFINQISAMPGGELLAARVRRQAKKVEGKEVVSFHCTDLENSKSILKSSMPFAGCPYCYHAGKRCGKDGCRGLGWVTESSWNAAPADYRKDYEGSASS